MLPAKKDGKEQRKHKRTERKESTHRNHGIESMHHVDGAILQNVVPKAVRLLVYIVKLPARSAVNGSGGDTRNTEPMCAHQSGE